MITIAQDHVASNSNARATSDTRQPWQTPKVIVSDMADAEANVLAVADGGGSS